MANLITKKELKKYFGDHNYVKCLITMKECKA